MLVRHAQSLANVDMKYYTTHSDYSVPLSEKGTHQAAESGRQIASYYRRKFKLGHDAPPPSDWLCRIWTSPYVRARQTSKLMMENSDGWITDIQENVLLVEQNFGLFEGVDWYSGELDDKYPDELHHYQKAAAFGGRFWAKIPLGESRFDVCMRVSQSFGTIHRDVSRCNIRNFVIVSHGTTLRAFMMMWLRLLPEWFEEEPNPSNASIRVIDDYQDEGYIWPSQHGADLATTVLDNSLLHGLPIQSELNQVPSDSNPLREIHSLPITRPEAIHPSSPRAAPLQSAARATSSTCTPSKSSIAGSPTLNGLLTPNAYDPSHHTPGHILTSFSAQYGGSEDALLRSSASIRPPPSSSKPPASSPQKSTQE
jgi:broad specificity phosphatase PhoE